MIFSLLGSIAPAPEEALETSADLEPATPLLPATAPESEQVHFFYFKDLFIDGLIDCYVGSSFLC